MYYKYMYRDDFAQNTPFFVMNCNLITVVSAIL